MGGVNPIEWILPPVALTHMAVDATSKAAGGDGVTAPGSPDAKMASAQEDADQTQRQALGDQARQAQDAQEARDAATETSQEATESRKRAKASYSMLSGQGAKRGSATTQLLGGSL